MIRMVLLLLALALPAHATQDAVPGLYDVVGVAANDVLNVRSRPDVRSPIVGTFAPDAQGIEVVALSEDLRWARVNVAEQSAWVSYRFLSPRPGEWDGRIPARMSCFGTEPFWSMAFGPDRQTLTVMDAPDLTFKGEGDRVPAAGRRDRWSMRNFEDGRSLTMVVATQSCSDGMSDRSYGLSVDVLLSTNTGHDHLSGCCSLQP